MNTNHGEALGRLFAYLFSCHFSLSRSFKIEQKRDFRELKLAT